MAQRLGPGLIVDHGSLFLIILVVLVFHTRTMVILHPLNILKRSSAREAKMHLVIQRVDAGEERARDRVALNFCVPG